MTFDPQSIKYYQERAKEYEQVYQKVERQTDLASLKKILPTLFENKRILEIACGTGYWTETIAQTAKEILATDINEAVLEIARLKNYISGNVRFQCIDLWQNHRKEDPFDALFGGFIWSHIPKQDLPRFIAHCQQQLKPGGLLVFLDNRYVEGSSTKISRRDSQDNTYQQRTLQSKATYEILKNFPRQQEFSDLLDIQQSRFEWLSLEYYWLAQWYKV